VWPIADEANVLENNLSIYVNNLYGDPTPGLTSYSSLAALGTQVNGAIVAVAGSACKDDPKAAAAVTASSQLIAFLDSLKGVATTNDPSLLRGQSAAINRLTETVRSALDDSPCISGLTPPIGGQPLPPGGAIAAYAPVSAGSTSLVVPVTSSSTYPAIALVNVGPMGVTFSGVDVEYADGSTRAITFGQVEGDGDMTLMAIQASVGDSAGLTIDVDSRPMKTLTFEGMSVQCALPPGGGADGGGGGCSTTLKILGLAQGNGLSP
jgi:hypothetical protein